MMMINGDRKMLHKSFYVFIKPNAHDKGEQREMNRKTMYSCSSYEITRRRDERKVAVDGGTNFRIFNG